MNASDSQPDEVRHTPAVITVRSADMTVGIALFLFALLIIWTNYSLGAGWGDEGPEAGYFPLRLGVLILLASVAVVFQAWRAQDMSAFVEQEQLRLVAVVLVPLVAYIALIYFIGIYVSSALFIAGFMLMIGKFSWWKSSLTGVAIMLVIFGIFELQFKVPLPKGPLEQLFGY